jgi:hypothetical protein
MKRSILISLLAFASCSTMDVKTNYVPNANFAQYRTYAWLPNKDTGQTAQLMHGSPAEQALKSDVAQQLATKGIQQDTTGNPDFLIAYHVMSKEKTDVMDWGYGYGWGGGADVYQYTQGTLVLDFIDPRTQQAFWRGYASDVVNDPSQAAGKVGEAVTKMMEKYPPPSNVAATHAPASQ